MGWIQQRKTHTQTTYLSDHHHGVGIKKNGRRSENRLFGSESDGWGRIVTRSDLRYIDITLRFHFGGLWCSPPSAASIPSSEQANICCNSNVTSACRTQFILWKGPDVSMQWQSSHSSWMHITQLNRVFYSAARVVLWNPARPWRTATPLLSTCLYPSLHWRGGGVEFGFKSTGCGVTPPSILFIFFLL